MTDTDLDPHDKSWGGFWDQRLRQFPNERGVGHRRFPLSYNIQAYEIKLAVLDHLLDKYRISTEKESVLDVGCGIGKYSQFYRARGAKVTGIDFVDVPSLIQDPQVLEGIDFIHADIADENLDLGSRFDLISVFEVFLHITNENAIPNNDARSGSS